MRDAATGVRRASALAALLVFAVHTAGGADDAAAGYARVRPSLVKVWAFDRSGHPTASGSGIVIVSNAARSLVLTAAHVVDGAASVRIDIDRDRHDLVARVERRSPRDLALLAVDRGNLSAATFAARSHAVVEGNVIAVAGFVEHDELIGVVGQEPRLLYPGTVSSRPDDGAYLELENVHVEEGLSGGPVFDPQSGDVLGIVTSRTSDQRGGFADSAALVVLPFLDAGAVGFRERSAAAKAKPIALAPPPPQRTPAPQRTTSPPAPQRTPSPAAPLPRVPQRTSPERLSEGAPATPRALAAAIVPAAPAASVPRHWETHDADPHEVEVVRGDCTIALSVAVTRLAFELPPDAGPGTPPAAKLTLRIARRVAATRACADVPEHEALEARYDMAAASYDGRHVTLRFSQADPAAGADGDAGLIPADVSVDADLTATPVTAHVQLIDADWDGTLDLPASGDR